MYDIKQVKDMIENGGIAVNEKLQERIMNDQMTEEDHAFVSRAFETMRGVTKHGIEGYKEMTGFIE
ncbi:hypothetical protein [Paenibacillus harenae]|uniref:hypothetical protein n=1 Tax=Paenibacillus harenae TaxID=306543 RepID=UPI00279348AD|nr:hypothetical protein [Paenibacillus harenae]MDQ0062372.1 hypothetical protein [Paenibacillus harenae]